MNRMTNWCIGLCLLSALLAVGQQTQLQPRFPEDALASQQLIAWSRLQKPQPAPQPLPPREMPVPQPDSQSQPPARGSENPQAQQQVPTQSFTGKILKDGGKYVLKVSSNTTYQLSEQGDVKQYENQNVKVIGYLDTDSNTIRVVKIELLS
jgi:Protein of unknown function (DUF5818)